MTHFYKFAPPSCLSHRDQVDFSRGCYLYWNDGDQPTEISVLRGFLCAKSEVEYDYSLMDISLIEYPHLHMDGHNISIINQFKTTLEQLNRTKLRLDILKKDYPIYKTIFEDEERL